jgi:NADH:ubiquinone oxidoreductase subunit C
MQENKIKSYAKFNLIQYYGNLLYKSLPKYILGGMIVKDELIIIIEPKYVSKVLYFLRDHTNSQYKVLSDITCVDLQSENRFSIIYNLLSIRYTFRLRIKILVKENIIVSSVTNIYNSSN